MSIDVRLQELIGKKVHLDKKTDNKYLKFLKIYKVLIDLDK